MNPPAVKVPTTGLPDVLEPKMEIARGAQWLRQYLQDSGKECYVLGLSGGLDSAVVALWAARAVGQSRLRIYCLPYGDPKRLLPLPLEPSSIASIEDAEQILHLIPGAPCKTIDIAPAVDAVLVSAELVGANGLGRLEEMAAANAKARIRATLLRTLTNVHDGLLLGTENRTENLLGYFTAGGDEQSDLEILPSFLKSQVRRLAEELGVPGEIIRKTPVRGSVDRADG